MLAYILIEMTSVVVAAITRHRHAHHSPTLKNLRKRVQRPTVMLTMIKPVHLLVMAMHQAKLHMTSHSVDNFLINYPLVHNYSLCKYIEYGQGLVVLFN